MACRNARFEVEQIEQLALIDRLPTHHDAPPSPSASRRRNHDSSNTTRTFSTASVKTGNALIEHNISAFPKSGRAYCRCRVASLTAASRPHGQPDRVDA